MSTTAERPLRKDAERNRRRILDAAREVFAERGIDAGLDQIARHAGLGVGTVYRRFPDKGVLIDALFEERIGAIAELAEEAAAHRDPWAGLVFFFERSLAEQAADRGLKQILISGARGCAQVSAGRERIAPPLHALVERAHAAGVLREDVTAQDIPMVSLMLGSLMDASREVAPELWRRYLELLLDGLRAGGPGPREPLSVDPLDPAGVQTVLAAWKPCRA
jgi:AcrR family transcriptional regulator